MNKDKSLSVANSSKTGRNCINCVGIQAGLGYSEFGYDEIGNSTDWAANSLNQYAQFAYDPDGNLLSDGVRTFASDGWNLVEERVAYANGRTSTIRYHWGKDLSGTLQGAGGVGGLLCLTVDGMTYIPCYDANGNVTRYLDADGNTVARYTYGAFGNIVSQSGPLAGFFRHRFSTKYYDAETGLYYYGYRFYHPALMRWLNRDPLEEEGGVNLYEFCGNATPYRFDKLGKNIYVYTGNNSGRWLNDHLHQAVVVDKWSSMGGRAKIIGKVGFSFGYNGHWSFFAPCA